MAALGRRRERRRRRRSVEPDRRDLLRRPLPRRRRRPDRHLARRLRLQPRRLVRERGARSSPTCTAATARSRFTLDRMQQNLDAAAQAVAHATASSSRPRRTSRAASRASCARLHARADRAALLSDRLALEQRAGVTQPSACDAHGRADRAAPAGPRSGAARSSRSAQQAAARPPSFAARRAAARRPVVSRAATSSRSAAARASSPPRTPTTTTRPSTSRRRRAPALCARGRGIVVDAWTAADARCGIGFTIRGLRRPGLDVLPPVGARPAVVPARRSRPASRSASSARPATPPAPTSTCSSSPRPRGRSRRPGSSPSPAGPSAGRTATRARRRTGRSPSWPPPRACLRRPPFSRSSRPRINLPPWCISAARGLRFRARFADNRGDGLLAACPSAPSGSFRAAGTRRDGGVDLRRRAPGQRHDGRVHDHPLPTPPLVVPDVRNQAFVFAKGALEDAGFAWRVVGSVHGYAANTVVAQSPAAGTRVLDTGAPLITLTLHRNSAYPQSGSSEDVSPYRGTVLAARQSRRCRRACARVADRCAGRDEAEGRRTRDAARRSPPRLRSRPPLRSAAAKTTWPQNRPAAFTVPGARAEPLDEMPLPTRALELRTWLDAHPTQVERERRALALPERLDRRRREVRLVARGRGPHNSHRRRPPRPAAVGHWFKERTAGTRAL